MKSKFQKSANGITVMLLAALLLITIEATAALLICQHYLGNDFTIGENINCIEEKFDEYEQFEAGEVYEKEVTVRNTGNVDCYVRVFAEVEDPLIAETLGIDFNEDDWTEKQDDGFYYYRKVLSAGNATEPLFTRIIAEEDTNRFRMICYSETIQAEGGTDSMSAFRSR